MLIKQIYGKNVIFVIIGILKILVLNESSLCNGCHDLMQGNAYRINFWYMSRDDAINVMNSSILDKRCVL